MGAMRTRRGRTALRRPAPPSEGRVRRSTRTASPVAQADVALHGEADSRVDARSRAPAATDPCAPRRRLVAPTSSRSPPSEVVRCSPRSTPFGAVVPLASVTVRARQPSGRWCRVPPDHADDSEDEPRPAPRSTRPTPTTARADEPVVASSGCDAASSSRLSRDGLAVLRIRLPRRDARAQSGSTAEASATRRPGRASPLRAYDAQLSSAKSPLSAPLLVASYAGAYSAPRGLESRVVAEREQPTTRRGSS